MRVSWDIVVPRSFAACFKNWNSGVGRRSEKTVIPEGYILGGGWSHILRLVPPAGSSVQPPPTQFAIAVSLLVDWNDANRPIGTRVAIEPQDERPAIFEVQAQIRAGRPAQATPGDPLRVLMALPVLIQFPEAGGYCARARMEGGRAEEVVRFQVADAQMMLPPAPG